MPDLEDDLRSTADAIAGDAAQLAALEDEKAGLDADDPRMIELSAEADGRTGHGGHCLNPDFGYFARLSATIA